MGEFNFNQRKFARFDSMDSSDSSNSSIQYRIGRSRPLWRPKSLLNLVSPMKKNLLQSSKSTDRLNEITTNGLSYNDKGKYDELETSQENNREGDAIINIILVEAKGLPDAPSDGMYHSLYCKISLGSESYKSKSVPRSRQPEWREKLKLSLYNDHLLKVSLWDRGTQRHAMGSCVIDLSKLNKDRTYDIWERLDDGFGLIHLNITLCSLRRCSTIDDDENIVNWHALQEQFAFYKLKDSEWAKVGELQVRVMRAKGLNGKPNAYCTLEVDNERMQTHNVRGDSEPIWDKTYIFNIYDITSTLDLAVYDSSLLLALRDAAIGQVTVPLLSINNGEHRWYALKNKSKTRIANGNCPRILLEMNLVWNPVKASLKLFQPKEVKYIKKSPKFSTELLYHNVVALGTMLEKLPILNYYIIEFLEWDNRELCTVVLVGWLVFWCYFDWWIAPLLLLTPFIYYMVHNYIETCSKKADASAVAKIDEDPSFLELLTGKNNDLADKVQRVPETALTIVRSVDFMIMHAEKLHNLIRFKVPFLSYFVMTSLVMLSFVARFIYFKHIMMILGVYKYMRKYLNPGRKLNNDLLDFLSRIPDNNTLKEWKALRVPEPENY